MLGAVGAAQMHQQNFPLFLGIVLGVAALVVGVYFATAAREQE